MVLPLNLPRSNAALSAVSGAEDLPEAEDVREAPASRPPVPVLRVQGVAHRYGRTPVLEAVELEVGAGEIVCLVGPSGCGKTTTLRLVAGLEPLQTGTISIGDRVVSGRGVEVSAEGRNVGLMFQDYALFPHMRVLENVMFGIRDAKAEERRRRAMAVLGDVGLAHLAAGFPYTLSGGQQQRVALARALAPRPRVMLLDEPFSGLDSQLRGQIRDDTMHLLKESGAATLMVTHDPEEAMFMADRIAVMRAGRLEQVGTPEAIYCSPANAFVTSFFSDVNRLSATAHGGWVQTPLGQVRVRGIADGTPVEVLIRPEAIRLGSASAEASGVTRARVMAARMLGRSSLVHLSLATAPEEVHLHARVPGRFLPREGEILPVSLDSEQTFVFPV